MTRRKKPTPVQESEGEEFSDVIDDFSLVASDSEELVEDVWVFPIVGPQAKRAEYEAVCRPKLLNVKLTVVVTGTQRGSTQSK
jgi:hypothetical protein